MKLISIGSVRPDEENPRKRDTARTSLLRLSIAKLGYMMPLFVNEQGMLLSGHQRQFVTESLGIEVLPIEEINLSAKDVKGINIIFNRATNDFSAFDTGESASGNLNMLELIEEMEDMETLTPEQWPVNNLSEQNIMGVLQGYEDRFDKKSIVVANSLYNMNIKIPAVITETGRIVNGIHRLMSARSKGANTWPVVTISDTHADQAEKLLNYLSMDFEVNDDFSNLLRSSAFRRAQNNRGNVPKAMRFWANGERTLLDKDSYSKDYWTDFRNIHGETILDFGSGLSTAAPYLRKKDINAYDFEPYMIDMLKDKSSPDLTLSRQRATEFLDAVAEGVNFNSIFLCSVMNSIPFPKDRLMVLCIVNALCNVDTVVYGTCRDISDYTYEYTGIRQANYFVFDTEDGVRVGDVMRNPKIQKFHTQDEMAEALKRFWKKWEFWAGGNVFYYRAENPKRPNLGSLKQSLMFEFDLPFKDGETMGLGAYAISAFERRLGVKL